MYFTFSITQQPLHIMLFLITQHPLYHPCLSMYPHLQFFIFSNPASTFPFFFFSSNPDPLHTMHFLITQHSLIHILYLFQPYHPHFYKTILSSVIFTPLFFLIYAPHRYNTLYIHTIYIHICFSVPFPFLTLSSLPSSVTGVYILCCVGLFGAGRGGPYRPTRLSTAR